MTWLLRIADWMPSIVASSIWNRGAFAAAKTGEDGRTTRIANAIAALLDAPVTIEDRHFRVLAFSGRQDEADPSRDQQNRGELN